MHEFFNYTRKYWDFMVLTLHSKASSFALHFVEGSITPALVGENLTRMYQFSDGHPIIKSTRPDERWSVTWVHY